MFDENIISREYIKSHLFPTILKHLGDFLDHDKLDRLNDKLILPLKDNLDSDLLKKKSVQLRILLKEFIENNQDLQNLVKQRFANKLNINISELEISPWVPYDARINLPIKFQPDKDKKIAGALEWHQDTGSWYNLDLQLQNKTFIKENYWKLITYSNWIPICDCNNNGLEIIENSENFGLQNIKERLVSISKNRYYFQNTIIGKNLRKLSILQHSPKAGSCIHFNSLVLHRSMNNISNEVRCSFEFRFILKKREFIEKISKKILIKRTILKNFPLLFKLGFLPGFIYRKFVNEKK